ncbi:MAG: hypothetical protein A2857_01225 [Candidatus Levybacteria bacterium RIFCSPHIGHO2_01_FULL_36_15]|nr:MAG: hypothetical protein A2857_01225 [Candidatus Levybacteria bacterium RIFCSPHIGHO2_01_FULL_36_15]
MIRKEIITVIGIGRVGLPMALSFANEGFKVFGIGRNLDKIEAINRGTMPFMEEGGEILLKKIINKKFFATTDYSCIKNSHYIILTLGTPVDENMNPVYDQINAAIENSKPYFRPGQTLILRSTVSPRTTSYVKSLIDDFNGLKVGKNFFLAFCPERISEGKALEEIKSIPQIIGGIDSASSKKANLLFQKIGVETVVTDAVSAELAKLFTNMYRYINFAVGNEFMLLAANYNRDIYNIVNMVNYKYKRGGISLPGMTAGPCLFKDGFFLISDLPYTDLISTSWKINESIPIFLIKKIRERMKLEGKKTIILGLAFKSGIDDIRESLSFKVRKALLRERSKVVLHDPYVKTYVNQEVVRDVYQAIEGADLIFVATAHKQYKSLDMKMVKKLVKKNCLVCDVWNVFKTDKIIYKLNYLDKNEK